MYVVHKGDDIDERVSFLSRDLRLRINRARFFHYLLIITIIIN